MYQRVIWLCGVSIALLAGVSACSTGSNTGSTTRPSNGGTGNGTGGTGLGISPSGGSGAGFNIDCDSSQPGSPCNPSTPAPLGCGDGMLAEDEACDDGNRTDGDGCLGN